MPIPAEVTRVGQVNARRAGIDEADGISFAAEAWVMHPQAWRTVTFRRCVDQRRRESGRNGDDRRPVPILDQPPTVGDDDTLADLLGGACDGGYEQVEDLLDLARILGPLPDEDLARLARVFWLGMSWASCGNNDVMRSLRRARLGAHLPTRHPPAPPPTPCPLTAAELRVVAAIADGHTMARAARSLGISANTVKTHLGRIAAKIGTTNGTHTVATALRHDWIT